MIMLKIFIVILNWNGVKDTIQCLKSVDSLRSTDYSLNVVIVDNASTDDSVGQIEKYLRSFASDTDKISIKGAVRVSQISNNLRKTQYKFIKNQTNLGFAGGNNVGIRYAMKNKADYVLLLNNDTTVDKGLVAELLKVARKYPDAGAISPQIYFTKGFEFHKKRYKKSELGKVVWYAGGDMDWENVYGTNHGVDEVDAGQFDKVRETDFVTGACVMFSVKALKKVGMFDERYYLYLEDVDLSVQMKQKGWKVLFAPKAKLWHKVAQSSKIGSELNDYFITRNRMLFGMRYAPIRSKAALIKESWKFLLTGRKWQKVGIKDFYLGIYGKGSWR